MIHGSQRRYPEDSDHRDLLGAAQRDSSLFEIWDQVAHAGSILPCVFGCKPDSVLRETSSDLNCFTNRFECGNRSEHGQGQIWRLEGMQMNLAVGGRRVRLHSP